MQEASQIEASTFPGPFVWPLRKAVRKRGEFESVDRGGADEDSIS
jgi:hypothetical protein